MHKLLYAMLTYDEQCRLEAIDDKVAALIVSSLGTSSLGTWTSDVDNEGFRRILLNLGGLPVNTVFSMSSHELLDLSSAELCSLMTQRLCLG